MVIDIQAVRRANLILLIDESGGQRALAAKGEDINSTYLSQLVRGKRPIGERAARSLEQKLGLEQNWFEIDRRDESTVMDAANTALAPQNRGLIPVISWIQAGGWNQAEDYHAPGGGDDFLPCPVKHSKTTYALRVVGDSMTAPYGRSYPEGAIIYVDPEATCNITTGDRVIAKINGEDAVTFKSYVNDGGRKFLKALNPAYPMLTDEFRVLGKVIGMWVPE